MDDPLAPTPTRPRRAVRRGFFSALAVVFGSRRQVRFHELLAGACLGVAIGLVVLAATRPDTPPAAYAPLMAEPTEIDLGALDQHQKRSATFRLTNRAEGPVFITTVLGSCGCTSHRLEASQIAPGKSTRLTATFDAGSARGKASSRLTLFYHVGRERKLRSLVLRLRARVRPAINTSPERIQFVAGRPGRQTVTLSPSDDESEPFRVTEALCTHLAFRAHIGRQAGHTCTIDVAFEPRFWTGDAPKRTWLIVTTTHTREPQVRVPIVVLEDRSAGR